MSRQNERLLAHLMEYGAITQLEAFNTLGVCRLSERVRELEAAGHVIEHVKIAAVTRNGTAHVTQYRLIRDRAAA